MNVGPTTHGNTVVRVAGGLLGNNSVTFKRTLIDEVTGSPIQLALEVPGVTRIDNAGVDALVWAATQAGESVSSAQSDGLADLAVHAGVAATSQRTSPSHDCVGPLPWRRARGEAQISQVVDSSSSTRQ